MHAVNTTTNANDTTARRGDMIIIASSLSDLAALCVPIERVKFELAVQARQSDSQSVFAKSPYDTSERMGYAGAALVLCILSGRVLPVFSDCSLQPGMNNHGVNLVQSTSKSAEDCCSQCEDEDACVGFTWVSGNQDCYLKSSVDPATPDPAVTNGSINGCANFNNSGARDERLCKMLVFLTNPL
jgi:hypothetical protein